MCGRVSIPLRAFSHRRLADERQELTPARRAALADAAQEAEHAATACVKRLLGMGAPVPGVPQERAGLADLLALEGARSDLLALAAGLRVLLPLAEKIDAARGRSLPDPVAGSCGLDLAEDLVQLLAQVELDLYGPMGKERAR